MRRDVVSTASLTMRWVRWLLLVPSAWLAWSVALVSGVAVHSALESLCPPEQVISGMCTATWFRYAERITICAGAGLAAALILLTSTFVAPSHRAIVIVATLCIGSAAALVMGVLAAAYSELATALVVGGLTTVWLLRRNWVRSSER